MCAIGYKSVDSPTCSMRVAIASYTDEGKLCTWGLALHPLFLCFLGTDNKQWKKQKETVRLPSLYKFFEPYSLYVLSSCLVRNLKSCSSRFSFDFENFLSLRTRQTRGQVAKIARVDTRAACSRPYALLGLPLLPSQDDAEGRENSINRKGIDAEFDQ